jgi:hypothetical protein
VSGSASSARKPACPRPNSPTRSAPTPLRLPLRSRPFHPVRRSPRPPRAETLDVSIDHLPVNGIPRGSLHAAQDILGDRLAAVAELLPDGLSSLLNIIDGLTAKNRLKNLASRIS